MLKLGRIYWEKKQSSGDFALLKYVLQCGGEQEVRIPTGTNTGEFVPWLLTEDMQLPDQRNWLITTKTAAGTSTQF